MTKYKRVFPLLLLLVSSLFLAGCSPTLPISRSTTSGSEAAIADSVALPDVLKGNHLVAVMDEQNILIADPAYPHPMAVYQLKETEEPLRPDLDTFLVSPSHNYIVWFAPQRGVMRLHIEEGKAEPLYTPTEWFAANPFIVMHPNQDRIYFVDEEGTKLISISLTDAAATVSDIPYPFGTQFAVSPNLAHIVFVSGYEQRVDGPQYMFTSATGENPVRFYTQVERADRGMLVWMPDSSGVVMIENGNSLVFHSVSNPEENRVLFSTESDERIIRLERVEDTAYVLTTAGRWRVIDLFLGKEVGRAPISIAGEMRSAEFYPWYNKSFLIQESVPTDEGAYNRLWRSDYRGVKKVVINKYHHQRIETDTPEI